MSIMSMGVRSALRQAQLVAQNPAPGGVVISALQPAGAGQAPAANPGNSQSPVGQLLEKLTAWIPTESIATFIAFAGFFEVFKHTAYEFTLVVVIAVLTVPFAIQASRTSQLRRGLTVSNSAAIKTAALAVFAFLIWWLATPGSWLTSDENVAPFYVAIGLLLVVFGLPFLASALKVEPVSS